jgi:hypothetical protein
VKTSGSAEEQGMIHDPVEDVSECRRPTRAQAEVIDLLELNPTRHHSVRLTLQQWRQIDRIASRLENLG